MARGLDDMKFHGLYVCVHGLPAPGVPQNRIRPAHMICLDSYNGVQGLDYSRGSAQPTGAPVWHGSVRTNASSTQEKTRNIYLAVFSVIFILWDSLVVDVCCYLQCLVVLAIILYFFERPKHIQAYIAITGHVIRNLVYTVVISRGNLRG